MSNLFWYDIWNAETDDLSLWRNYSFGSGATGTQRTLTTYDNKNVMKVEQYDQGYSRTGMTFGTTLSQDWSPYNVFNILFYGIANAYTLRVHVHSGGGQINSDSVTENFSGWATQSIHFDEFATLNHDWTDVDYINFYDYRDGSQGNLNIKRIWLSRYGYDNVRWNT